MTKLRPWYRKFYRCDECNIEWTDDWSCCCNDKCPQCDGEFEPYECKDISKETPEDEKDEGYDYE